MKFSNTSIAIGILSLYSLSTLADKADTTRCIHNDSLQLRAVSYPCPDLKQFCEPPPGWRPTYALFDNGTLITLIRKPDPDAPNMPGNYRP